LLAWQELTLPNVLILSPSKLECSSLSVTSTLLYHFRAKLGAYPSNGVP
jgi:hypothetical protein